jgi:broad specificity phosphatase PhoE
MAIETIINTVRHGKTVFNAARRYAGSIDISLSQEGIRDCRAAVKKLAGVKFDVVVTSTLRRAIETAEILAGSSKNMVKSKLCVERNFGIFEGKTWDEVQDIHPPVLYITVGNDLHSVNPQGSEHFEDVWMRAKKFRNYLFRYYRGKKFSWFRKGFSYRCSMAYCVVRVVLNHYLHALPAWNHLRSAFWVIVWLRRKKENWCLTNPTFRKFILDSL